MATPKTTAKRRRFASGEEFALSMARFQDARLAFWDGKSVGHDRYAKHAISNRASSSATAAGDSGRRRGSLASSRWTSEATGFGMPGRASRRQVGLPPRCSATRFGRVVALVRRPAGEHLVERYAQAVEVAPRIGGARRSDHLGRNVRQRAYHRPPGPTTRLAGGQAEPQVQQCRVAVGRQEDVAGLHVGVDSAGLRVERRQRIADLPRDPERLRQRRLLALLQQARQ